MKGAPPPLARGLGGGEAGGRGDRAADSVVVKLMGSST